MKTLENEPLKNHTTFRIGGAAKKFVEPKTVAEFAEVIKSLKVIGEKFFILGGGSNIVFSDNGFNGTVISTTGLNKITATKDRNENIFDYPFSLTCGAGCSIASVVNFTKQNCVTGFEKFSGLPGTVGGAVYMNARCFDISISDILDSVEYLDLESFEVKEYKFDAADWDYKKSPFQRTSLNCLTKEETTSTTPNSLPTNENQSPTTNKQSNDQTITTISNALSEEKKQSVATHNAIILSATFRLQMLSSTSDNLQKIADECKHYIDERVSKGHFKFPSAGSVFKNNHAFGKPSGKIIDEAGLRGYRIGGAQIAPFHGNFIINIDNATADNVRELVDYIKTTVKEKFGFKLEEEIIFVAE